MKKMSASTVKKIEELTSFWQSLLIDYHKDRDCHFYITYDFKYHSGLELAVSHYGYIADDFKIVVKDLDEALSVLERQMHRQILDEINSNLEREELAEKDRKFWENKKEEFKKIYTEQCAP